MRHLLWGISFFWAAGALLAQSDRATITGTVVDPTGAFVANAPIQARNVGTGVVYPGATSTTGNYTIAQLPVGTYELSVAVQGFKKYLRENLTVQVAEVMRIDVTLQVGSATESVTVTDVAPLLDTETGDLRHSVTVDRLDDLPVLGIGAGQAGSAGIRNPNAMIELVPGTVYQPNAEIRINGTPNNTQSFRIEGQDASNTGTPGVAAQTQPSVDAIQEIAIQTSNYAAEYGQVGGGYFNLTMRSGTNQFHGSAYDYFVNEVFNAGNPFTDSPAGTGNPRPRNRRNDYGFTVGGPVWIPKIYNGHDKTFFFFNWEQYLEHVAINTQLETVPTAAYEAGNFATAIPPGAAPIGTDPLGRPIYQGEIYDPTSTFTDPVSGKVVRNPFPNQVIPSTLMDPLALKVQGLFPSPLGPNSGGVVNNFIPNIPTTRNTRIPSVKLDQVVGSKGRLSFFWQRTQTTAPLSFTFGNVDGLPDPLATNLGTFQNAPLYRLNYDHTLRPTVLLHLGAGYRSNYFFVPAVNEEGQVPNFNASAFGFKGGLTNQFFPPISGLCTVGATTGSCTGQGGMQNFGNASYAENITQVPSFNASLSWVKQDHTYKFGSEFRTEGYPATSRANSSGSYAFSGNQTSLPYLNGTTLGGLSPGFGYASFLLGDVNSVSIANPVDPRLGKKQFGIYAQDSWKVTRKITFDYGVRYDYSTYLQEQYGRAPFFSPTTPNPAPGLGNILGAMIFDRDGAGHCNCNLAKNYPLAFAPRLGLAYQFAPKTVLRAGFGIVYAGTEANNNAVPGIAGSSGTLATPSFGTPVTTLSAGLPAAVYPPPWPNLNPGQFNLTPTPVSIAANPFLDPNAGRPARQYQWSVGIQREIGANFALDVSYVGNRGIWWQAPALDNLNAINENALLAHGINVNNPTQAALLPQALNSPAVIQAGLGGAPYPGFPLTQSLAQALRPFPQFTTINTYWDPKGDTWYDSLQVKATKRLSHGLNFVSTFVWQKTLVTGTEIGEPNPGTTGGAVVNDVFNLPIDKYISVYDQPFLFNISLNYTTPRLAINKALSWLARDWNYGAFLQYSSGFPIEAPLANNNLASALEQPTFANRVPGQPLFTQDLNCHCFDPNATFVLNPLAWTNPPARQFGTSAAYYSDYRTQRRPVENMNLGREWRVRERYKFQLRIEFTNIFNRAYVGNPASTNAATTQTRSTSGATAGNATSGFGYINTQSLTPQVGPRNGSLVARFSF